MTDPPGKQTDSSSAPNSGPDETLPDISLDHAHRAQPAVSTPPDSHTNQTAFRPGDRVANRFQILRFIAQGGMGEVYEALDIELKQKVALKTVRSVLLADVQSLERFRQEIVVAKRITHPNICRTYDLFRHESAKPGESDILIVSMELLAGKTLDHLLKEKGKLTTGEAFPLVKQMVAALAAAHRAGVVHRDFKSNNVMLVSQSPAAETVRVVITDFGLAHSLEPGELALTRTGEMLGTPAYMAPEQVTGAEITPATDIYSLGVAMFEMLTGKLPFEGKNWKELAFKRLEQPAPNPKSLTPGADEIWSGVILKCLERQPADRFQSVEEITDSIESRFAPPLRAEAQRKRRLLLLYLTTAGLLALIALGTFVATHYSVSPAKSTAGPGVTIMGFKNTTGDKTLDRWGEEFATNLGAVLDVKPIHYLYPSRFKNSWQPALPSEMPDAPSSDTLGTMHNFGCDFVLIGTYSVIGTPGARQILWTIRIVNAVSGETEATVPESFSESERLMIIRHAGEDVRQKLGVSLSNEQKMQVERSLPANEDASVAFAQGNAKMRNFEYLKARDLFETAAQLDPTNAEIRSALAEAFWALGYEGAAQEQSKTALDASDGLPDEKVSLIRARFLSYSRDWEKAAQAYSALAQVFPSRYDYTLQLANNWHEASNYPKAVEALQGINAPNVPGGVKAQRDLQLAELYSLLGKKPEDRLQVINSASQEARAAGAGIIEARVEIQRCLVLLQIGQQGAEESCTAAVDLNSKQGDDLGTARAKNAVGLAYYFRNDYASAERLIKEALAIARHIGDKRDEAGALVNLGSIQYNRNDLHQAQKFYEESVRISDERRGIDDDYLLAKQNLATIAATLGDPAKAISIFNSVAESASDAHYYARLASARLSLCDALLDFGDVPRAATECAEAVKLQKQIGDKAQTAAALVTQASVLQNADDLPAAEANLREALRLQKELAASADAAYVQLVIADLSIEKNDNPSALRDAGDALQVLQAAGDSLGITLARCIVAAAYRNSAQLDKAKEQLDQAALLFPKIDDAAVRARFIMEKGKWQAKSGQSAAAVHTLNDLELEMRKKSDLYLALQIKLAAAQILTERSGESMAPRNELSAVAAEARKHGYLRIARQAESSRGS